MAYEKRKVKSEATISNLSNRVEDSMFSKLLTKVSTSVISLVLLMPTISLAQTQKNFPINQQGILVADSTSSGIVTNAVSGPTATVKTQIQPLLSGTGTAYNYKLKFSGRFNGEQPNTRLFWSVINRNSRVFVTASECDDFGNTFIGAAKYTVNNISPENGLVRSWTTINWGSPINLCASYLVINP